MYKRQGGVTESFYNLYAITGDERHRLLAQFFYHNEVIDPLKEPVSYTHLDVYKRQAYDTGNFCSSITGIPGGEIENIYLSNVRFLDVYKRQIVAVLKMDVSVRMLINRILLLCFRRTMIIMILLIPYIACLLYTSLS